MRELTTRATGKVGCRVVTVTYARPLHDILQGWAAHMSRRRVVPVRRNKPEGEAQGEPRQFVRR